jgi:hypothetical protein
LAKKKSHEEEIRRGIDELQKMGVSFEDASPEVVSRLEAELGKGRETDLAVVFCLGRVAEPAAVEALIRIEKSAAEKELKKEIRRSLFKLSQKGLSLPEGKNSESKTPTPILSWAPDIDAFMSPVDGSGGRLVWIAKPQPNHGLQLIQAMVNDREGLQRIGGANIRRKELRRMAQEIKQQHDVSMISIPWEYADKVLYEGFERAKSLGRSGLENFHELRSIVTTGKPKLDDHPVYSRLNSEEAREGAWRELSRRLLEEPEFRFWILDSDWIQPFIAQLQEAQSSRLVLNPVQKEERLAGIVRDAVKALCAGETGKIMQRRMEDMAWYFSETGRADLAKLALAVALQVKEEDPGPLDISFLTGFVQKSIAFYVSQQKTEREAEPSFIVKP